MRKNHTFRRPLTRRSGGAVLEMALCLTILFLITYGMIEFGYYFYVKNSMEGAAREGCRAGIVSGATNTTVNNAIIAELEVCGLLPSGSSTTGNYTVTTSPASVSGATTGNTLTVTITATWGTVGSGFRPMGLISSSKVLTCACAMRIEG